MRAPLTVRDALNRANSLGRALTWPCIGYRQPAPIRAKWAVLEKYGTTTDIWVETGTYFGRTSRRLSKFASSVITIEPEPALARRAMRKFSKNPKIRVIEEYSEVALPVLLPELSGKVAFWLDGHFSGGATAMGEVVTPICRELEVIEPHISSFLSITVFVDDFRLFASSRDEILDYPSKSFLVEWAERNKFHWTVEHDIFIASSERIS